MSAPTASDSLQGPGDAGTPAFDQDQNQNSSPTQHADDGTDPQFLASGIRPLKDDDIFKNVTDDGDDETAEELGDLVDDDKTAIIRKIQLGTAYVDVRHLSLNWDERLQMKQRTIKQSHVIKLRESFIKTNIRRVEFSDRLIVSMTREDLDKAISYTISRGGDKTKLKDDIEQHDSRAPVTTKEDVPKLGFPLNGNASRSTITCRVEAGQHRVRALKSYAARKLRERALPLDALVSPEPGDLNDAINLFGWTVTIVDADELLKPENARAGAMIRGNIHEVYDADSEGVEIANLFAHWSRLSNEQRAEYETNIEAFIAKYGGRFGDAAKRLKRIFTTRGVREVATRLTKSQWGKDLFTESAFDDLASMRCITFVSNLIEAIFERLCRRLEPSLMDLDHPPVGIENRITLADAGAVRECFKSNNTQELLLQLFFPTAISGRKHSFGLPELNYRDEVNIAENKMPELDDQLQERSNRHYRRPLFLDFLTAYEYHLVFKYLTADAETCVLVNDPFDNQLKTVYLPTLSLWSDIHKIHLKNFEQVLRFQWFCAAPQDYQAIYEMAKTGRGSTSTKWKNYDQYQAFEQAFILHRQKIAAASIEHPENATTRDRVITLNEAQAKAKSEAKSAFKKYSTALFLGVIESGTSIGNFAEGCKLKPEFVRDADSSPVLVDFYHQILAHSFLRPLFQGAFFKELGTDFLSGIAKPLGDPKIGSKNKSKAFFVGLDAGNSALNAVDKFDVFHYLTKESKMRVASDFQPFCEVMLLSFAVHRSALLMDEFWGQQHNAGRDATYEPADPRLWEEPLTGGIQNLNQYTDQSAIFIQGLTRLRELGVDLNDMSPTDWSEQPLTELETILPHLGHQNLNLILFNEIRKGDGTRAFQIKKVDQSESSTLAKIENQRALVEKGLAIAKDTGIMPYKYDDAKRLIKATQPPKEKRGNRSNPRVDVTDDNEDDGHDTEPPTPKVNRWKGKAREVDEDHDGDEGNKHSNLSDSDSTDTDTDIADIDFTPIGTPALPPVKAIQYLHRKLKIDDRNDEDENAQANLSGKKLGDSTKKLKEQRFSLVRKFCMDNNLPWVPVTKNDLPVDLRMMSKTEKAKSAKEADKAAGQPSSSKANKLGGRQGMTGIKRPRKA